MSQGARDDETTTSFKRAFRRHPAGVALVTAGTDHGPVGLTVSSLASVSADPPVLSFSVTRTGASAAAVVASDRVTVHTLSADQVDVAAAFARAGADRFTTEQGWVAGPADAGAPHLPGATATFRGRVLQVVPAGASWLVLVEVDEVEVGPVGEPLVHHDRAYHSTTPLAGVFARRTG